MRLSSVMAFCLTVVMGGPAMAIDASFGIPVAGRVALEGLSFDGAYRFGYVNGVARRGQQAQRFEIRHGDCGRASRVNDCDKDRGRVEMKEKPKNNMSRPNQGVWYGYSVLIPKDFVSLGRGNTMLGQVKAEGLSSPLWSLTFNDAPKLRFADKKNGHKLGSIASWKGRWIDITIYAHYGRSGQDVYFQLYKDGKLLCQRRSPFVPKHVAQSNPKLGLKYGIYNSFVSRYLAKHGRTPAAAKKGPRMCSDGKCKSPSATPFRYEWGVRLPTHVIYYDEMRFGARREHVDVRMLEARGVPPVD
jgi:hypothetical protein